MSSAEVYRRARQLGFRLEARPGGKLSVIPGDKVPPDLVEALKSHKGALLDRLPRPTGPGWQPIPAAELPLNPAIPRPTPQERKHLIACMLRQTVDCHRPLAAWLVRRELAYYDGPGRTWDCGLHPYAAARDAACWQLGRSEADLHDFLVATEEIASRRNQRKDRWTPGPARNAAMWSLDEMTVQQPYNQHVKRSPTPGRNLLEGRIPIAGYPTRPAFL